MGEKNPRKSSRFMKMCIPCYKAGSSSELSSSLGYGQSDPSRGSQTRSSGDSRRSTSTSSQADPLQDSPPCASEDCEVCNKPTTTFVLVKGSTGEKNSSNSSRFIKMCIPCYDAGSSSDSSSSLGYYRRSDPSRRRQTRSSGDSLRSTSSSSQPDPLQDSRPGPSEDCEVCNKPTTTFVFVKGKQVMNPDDDEGLEPRDKRFKVNSETIVSPGESFDESEITESNRASSSSNTSAKDETSENPPKPRLPLDTQGPPVASDVSDQRFLLSRGISSESIDDSQLPSLPSDDLVADPVRHGPYPTSPVPQGFFNRTVINPERQTEDDDDDEIFV